MFITLEGPEGGGKSSQIRLLYDFLQAQGIAVRLTREPGGTSIGDEIRACVHNVQNTAMCPEAELLLYSASRAQLVWEVIRPSLAAGSVVLCDRYYDSTLAYQGYGRGLDLTALRQITHFATGGLKPDLTILLDIDVTVGLARRTNGGVEMNRLDLETVAFHQRVRQGYHQLAVQEPARWVIIDAGRPSEVVQADLRAIVVARFSSVPDA
ncbi:MAG: dTMP kinase [Chloroflexi bacterium]|nr:dTMP kinase [Ardenticatenaceae bacterium]MBL1128377.1 dTMP kinase [Chloroflexota bacterium]NOG34453.1 dTMP kinase [Chloroflexota bacterium]